VAFPSDLISIRRVRLVEGSTSNTPTELLVDELTFRLERIVVSGSM
jgi:hypothetical protein